MAISPAKIPFSLRQRANLISKFLGGGGGAATLHTTNRVKNASDGTRALAGDAGGDFAEGVHCGGDFGQKEHTQILRPKGAFLQIPSPCLLSCVAHPAPSPCQVPAKSAKNAPVRAEMPERRHSSSSPNRAVQRTPLAAPNSLFSAVCACWRRAALHLLHAYVPAPIVGLGQWRRRRNLQSVVKVGIT